MSIFSWFHDSFGAMFGGGSPATTGINPATGLPMAGGVDVQGNPYGTDLSHQAHHHSSQDGWHSHSPSWHDYWS